MSDQLKQFFVVKLIYFSLYLFIFYFTELAIQLFKDMSEIYSDVIGLDVL